jgi:hypothetical protein
MSVAESPLPPFPAGEDFPTQLLWAETYGAGAWVWLHDQQEGSTSRSWHDGALRRVPTVRGYVFVDIRRGAIHDIMLSKAHPNLEDAITRWQRTYPTTSAHVATLEGLLRVAPRVEEFEEAAFTGEIP